MSVLWRVEFTTRMIAHEIFRKTNFKIFLNHGEEMNSRFQSILSVSSTMEKKYDGQSDQSDQLDQSGQSVSQSV